MVGQGRGSAPPLDPLGPDPEHGASYSPLCTDSSGYSLFAEKLTAARGGMLCPERGAARLASVIHSFSALPLFGNPFLGFERHLQRKTTVTAVISETCLSGSRREGNILFLASPRALAAWGCFLPASRCRDEPEPAQGWARAGTTHHHSSTCPSLFPPF